MFPFFPLKRCFDYQNEQHWRCLLDDIQCTLLQFGKNIDRDHFNLTLDFFWMAFVATYPSFPGGEWATWDAQINMDGMFITTWLGDAGLQQPGAQCSSSIYFWWTQGNCWMFLLYINPFRSVALYLSSVLYVNCDIPLHVPCMSNFSQLLCSSYLISCFSKY